MTIEWIGVLKIGLTFGLVIGWCLFEIWRSRRHRQVCPTKPD